MRQPRRTQAERREETHAALVRAAVAVIARKGFAEATLQEIADEAEVSKGGVMYHFPTKDELVEPVLAHCVAYVRAAATAAWRREAPPAERMRAALRAMWAVRREGGPEVAALADLFARGVHDAGVRARVAAHVHAAEGDLARELEAAVAALGMRPRVPPATLPRLLLATLDGLALHHFVAGGDDDAIPAALETLAFSLFTF